MRHGRDNPQALLHRQRAIQQLGRMLEDHQNLDESPKNEIIATCLVLRFQCHFLNSCFAEMLALIRLTFSLTSTYRNNLEQATPIVHNYPDVAEYKNSLTFESYYIDERIIESAIASLVRIEHLVQADRALQEFHQEMKECFYCFYQGILTGFERFRELYFRVICMPHHLFNRIFNGNSAGVRLLTAHCIALFLLVRAFRSATITENLESPALGHAPDWICDLCRGSETSIMSHGYTSWPMAVTAAIQNATRHNTPQYSPMSSAQLLKMMVQQPVLFV